MRHGKRLVYGQGMTEYAIIVALIAISGITAFSYFGGVQRSQVAAITQELAGQESGDMLDLAASYGRRARDVASREIDLSNFYAGGGSSGRGSGTGGGIGGGWTPPGGGGGWTPPGGGIFPPPGGGGGGLCPASAAEKASGTMYVWVASDADCTEPKPLVKAVYLSDKLDFIKTAVKDFDILKMFESYFPEGKTISFKVDNTISGSMRVLSTEPDTIFVNLGMLTGPDNKLEAKHFASIVGHEIVHIYDINYRKKLYPALPIDNRLRWQSEINATQWQRDNFDTFGILRRDPEDFELNIIDAGFIDSVNAYQRKARNCVMTPTDGDCL